MSGFIADQATGAVPLRREIRDLQNNFPDQWNVYLLGLKDFQETDENDPLSYYQIAGRNLPRFDPQCSNLSLTCIVLGIHGLPYKAWNDVEGNDTTGYCTHSSILFPTWHRPYLALFEVSVDAGVDGPICT